jgi:uncharacterized protein (UPF0305 family)
MDQLYLAGRGRDVFRGIMDIHDKSTLAETLAGELGRLNVADLQRISASLELEINKLPSPYRERIRPYFTEQFFGSYFKLMRMHGDGTLKSLRGEIKDIKTFEGFCRMVLDRDDVEEGPLFGGYYYLVSCFAMFVLDEPGHPAGMPFPGGFTVEHRDDGFYCPIRDKEKDVPFAICNFCPARQSEMP